MRSWSSLGLLLTCAVLSLSAQGPVAAGQVREGTLSFDGHSTVADFIGTTTAVEGEMTGGTDLGEVRGWVEAPVDSLKTGNARRDRDLIKSMESGKYPRLRFQLTGVTPTVRSADSMDVTLMGEFAIHGETRPVSLPARVVFSGSTVRVASTFPLNLKDYRIGGLTKMLGLLKMDPGILVHVDLTFQLATP